MFQEYEKHTDTEHERSPRVLIHLGCRRELLAMLTLAADTVACFENGAVIERAPVHNFQGRESDHRIPEKMGKTLGDRVAPVAVYLFA